MGRMARSGAPRRESHVWTPGRDGRMHVEDVTELARLFTAMPPQPLARGGSCGQFALDRGLSRPVYEWPHYVGAYMLVNT